MEYRKEIDGLRALAIIPVIIFHLSKDFLPGGFIGVDIFFVISGFLITSIIINDYKKGTFSFRNFWMRRVRRILPVLTVVVLATLIAGSYILYAPDLNKVGTHGIASLLSYANISHLLMAGNYWGGEAEQSPFLHTWSLSLEEQFYLFFPIFIIFILSKYGKYLNIVIFSSVLLSLFVFFYRVNSHPTATFYILPTRAWELGIGALIATINLNNNKINSNNYISFTGIAIVIISFFCVQSEQGTLPTTIFLPVIGTALIILFTNCESSYLRKILSFSPLVIIGKLSYSLYLWHWPVILISEQYCIKNRIENNVIIIILITFILSVISYNFVELKFRSNINLIPYLATLFIVTVSFSYYLKINDFTEDISKYNKTFWHGNSYNVNPKKEWPESVKKRMLGIELPPIIQNDTEAFAKGGIQKLYGKKYPEIVVIGDSHALMWANVIDEVAEELKLSVAFFSADGTPAFFNVPPEKSKKGTIFFTAEEKYLFDKARLKAIYDWRPRIVIISCSWGNIKDIESTLPLINYISNIGSKILLVEQPPLLPFGDRNAPQYLSYQGVGFENIEYSTITNNETDNYKNGDRIITEIISKYDSCHRVSVRDLFLVDNNVKVIESNDVLYIDDDHLSYAGARAAKNRFISAFRDL